MPCAHQYQLPVCTLSPIYSSHIATDFPFSRMVLAVDGKQPSKPKNIIYK